LFISLLVNVNKAYEYLSALKIFKNKLTICFEWSNCSFDPEIVLAGQCDLVFSLPDDATLDECDVIFFATPHGVAMEGAGAFIEKGIKVIDLKAYEYLSALKIFKNKLTICFEWSNCSFDPEIVFLSLEFFNSQSNTFFLSWSTKT
jgi:hypothetical protein